MLPSGTKQQTQQVGLWHVTAVGVQVYAAFLFSHQKSLFNTHSELVYKEDVLLRKKLLVGIHLFPKVTMRDYCLFRSVLLSLTTLHLAEVLHKLSQKSLPLLASWEVGSGKNIIPYLFLHKFLTSGSVLKPGHIHFESFCLHRWCWRALVCQTSVPPGMLHANMCIVYIGICSVKTIDLILGEIV